MVDTPIRISLDSQAIVFHYSKIGYWPGTAVLARMDIDVDAFTGWEGPKPARIELADR
ncbi:MULTISPECIES: hypothetical protein [Tsukamurella]|uniref:Uncharacterized protein n=1 Tax=Tsukamurella columbiensis TaxID=128509 RepID=A0ABX1LHU2_9ACTN|nr:MULTISPECIES: hypothetical protein [Tsukamurella]NMD57135.1 hypothetical protein [Tsukamurella columbiensis]